ncbi:POT family protein [Nitzschia inconspicua]|uniref:POT family protein n=1 Tax=Nitzschia inconspicua TaxID=303405 RepID=A0A9K3PZK5_9STRA|nr:POT family protein [Nitzschia inconspicua]
MTSSSSDNQQQELRQLLQKPFASSSQPPTQIPRSVDSSPVVSPEQHDPYQPQRQPLSIDDNLPTNICSEEQLASLPDVCLSGNKNRPLRHVNEQGDVSTYALRPMYYSVIFILLVELLERFSFYGVNYTQTSFLTGAYNEDWNADMTAIGASSYVSISTAVAYSMPFVGAFLADNVLGDYWSILFGNICFYIPGLMLILLSTVPYLLGDTFNKQALSIGLLGLWPMGTGIVKSIVNVFGAKQFHPLLQSSLIESYYVSFYMCINIGALVGGIVVPVVAQYDVTLAYTYPMAMLCIGVLLFLLGTPRYVRQPPAGDFFASVKRKIAGLTPRFGKKKFLPQDDPNDAPTIPLTTIFKISALIIPFNIAYSQMATTFIVQGTVMEKGFGIIDASTMNNADAVSVLLFGHLVGSQLYPALARRNIKIPTTYKFAIGSTLGALAIGWALFIEYLIHSTYHNTGAKVNILWQSLAYVLIGAGEIFAVSAAYEIAFTSSAPETKAIASALNLFCVGGIPSVLCIFLYNACRAWFKTSRGTTSIHNVEDYATAQVYKYFLVLFLIALLGIVINLLPSVKNFVISIEEQAIEMIKTPVMKKRPKRTYLAQSSSGTDYSPTSDEESPLLRAKRHQAYLKYGSGPVLYKSGSMRAGPSLGHDDDAQRSKKKKVLKKSQVGKLYRITPSAASRPNVVMTPEGKPIKAGNLAGGAKRGHFRQESM